MYVRTAVAQQLPYMLVCRSDGSVDAKCTSQKLFSH